MGNVYDNLIDIHHLIDYMPYDDKYGYLMTNVIFACNKITDVYMVCSIARANLHYMDNEDYGDFARDDNSKLFVNTLLLQDALLYYNFLIDLSWQVLWLYYDASITNSLPTNELYQECVKQCDYESLRFRLTLAKELKLRVNFVESFFNDSLVQEVRELYNYIKHRGAVHFPGLGLNDTEMSATVNGFVLPLVSRRSIDINALKDKLIKFDNFFVRYFLDIVKILIPEEYFRKTDYLASLRNYFTRHREQIYEWNQNRELG